LPHYLSIERKPESGCEIWSCCDGRIGIMIQIKIVKSAELLSFVENETRHNNAHLNLGTKVLLDLVRPWYNSNRVVVADSFFSSVQTASCLLERGMKYGGVVKTATKHYPIEYLAK
jgi:Transposase IS4